jgi:hypothetical protein
MEEEFLDSELGKLIARISQLAMFRVEASKMFQRQERDICERHRRLPEWSSSKTEGNAYHFYYRSPSTGDDVPTKNHRQNVVDQIEFNTLQHMKTYQWLLAEGYEVFEDFIENVYAFCGFQELNLWVPPQGKPASKPTSLEGYRTLRYPDKVRTPYRQLKAFRTNSDHFARCETGAITRTNYRAVFALIEKLRHDIVHEGGYTKDLNKLIISIQNVVSEADKISMRGYIKTFFVTHNGRHLIDLLPIPSETKDGSPNGAYHETMDTLFRVLVEYAQLIIDTIYIVAQKKTK